MGLEDIIQELDNVLSLKGDGQLLSYDTTFLLGDFYVSPLIFRHVLFKEQPAVFLIHERKFIETHEALFKMCAMLIPSLSKANVAMVTDRERAIVVAVQNNLPNVKLVFAGIILLEMFKCGVESMVAKQLI